MAWNSWNWRLKVLEKDIQLCWSAKSYLPCLRIWQKPSKNDSWWLLSHLTCQPASLWLKWSGATTWRQVWATALSFAPQWYWNWWINVFVTGTSGMSKVSVHACVCVCARDIHWESWAKDEIRQEKLDRSIFLDKWWVYCEQLDASQWVLVLAYNVWGHEVKLCAFSTHLLKFEGLDTCGQKPLLSHLSFFGWKDLL